MYPEDPRDPLKQVAIIAAVLLLVVGTLVAVVL